MIGPQRKKMPDRTVCTGCDAIISKMLGGTKRFPEIRTVNYCTQRENIKPGNGIRFLKGFPHTPAWCPARSGRNKWTKLVDKAENYPLCPCYGIEFPAHG